MALHMTTNPPQVEYDDSDKESISVRPDGQSYVRFVQVAGIDLENFIKSMLGYSRMYSVFSSPNPTAIERLPPERHPKRQNLYARSVEFVRELGAPTDHGPFEALQFEQVELSVTYESVPGVAFKRDNEKAAGVNIWDESWRYIGYERTTGIEGRIIPKGILLLNKHEVNTTTGAIFYPIVPEPGTAQVPTHDIRITWYQVPAAFDALGTPILPGNLATNWASCVGKMNNAAFRGEPKESLFCLAPTKVLRDQPDGTLCWDITYNFLGRGEKDVSAAGLEDLTDTPSWTRLLNGEGTYTRVFRKSDPTRVRSVYDGADFSKLLTCN